VVPVDKKIRVVLSASEEIHSWHIPDLGVKQYAVPGLVRDTWFLARATGTYRGLCSAEACGEGRACVPIVVKVVSDGDYRKWVDGRRKDLVASSRNAG
jgi:cytochrome c oxidase subunit 2